MQIKEPNKDFDLVVGVFFRTFFYINMSENPEHRRGSPSPAEVRMIKLKAEVNLYCNDDILQ